MGSFEYRLMQRLQSAIPTVTIYIETCNPDFSGCIITLWDSEIQKKIELRLPANELNEWAEAEPIYISKIVKYLKEAYRDLKIMP